MKSDSRIDEIFPKVSILLPTYAQEDKVLEAIDSALAQDYPNLEVIVADDASPDYTESVIQRRRDSRLRYHRNAHNLGRVANYRNALYHLATGDWCVNLDGDDCFTDPTFISSAIKLALTDSRIVMVAAGCITQSATRRVIRIPRMAVVEGRSLLEDYRNLPYRLKHMATLYKRDDALAIGFYRFDVTSSDWESLFRLALRGKVAFLPQAIGIWNVHESNASGTSDWRLLADNLKIWPGIYAEAVSAGMDPEIARRALRHVLCFFAYLALSKILANHAIGDARSFVARLWDIDKLAACRTALYAKTIAKFVLAIVVRPWARRT